MGCGPSKGKTSAAVDALFDPASGEHDAGDFRIVRVWSKDDPRFDACVDVMARSFCGTTTTAPEPTIDWAYCNRDAAAAYMPLPEAPSEARLAFYVWCSKFILMMTVSRGGTYALVDKASSAVVAATGTVPPGAPPIPNGTNCEVMSILSAVGEPPKDDTDQKSQKRMEACDAWMARIHKQCMGKQKHLYVQTFFSDPTFQGKGCGKALLKLVEALADADGVPAYLETAGERNAGFYAAKGGFVTQATAPIDAGKLGTFDAAGGGVAMVRRAAGGGGGRGRACFMLFVSSGGDTLPAVWSAEEVPAHHVHDEASRTVCAEGGATQRGGAAGGGRVARVLADGEAANAMQCAAERPERTIE